MRKKFRNIIERAEYRARPEIYRAAAKNRVLSRIGESDGYCGNFEGSCASRDIFMSDTSYNSTQ
ncbi:hypothetical protein M422DRAFT_39077 [Sphaerobolus stellatus SS14]|uniref:Uncharacterized protein n=1 Tax=Sphaerobolus stellatus (strain SS14) TaxID=990650 RepID=A0A0C9T6P5_SPHS4|nr:hypothetical protein M422DRAFT_39077 [Sphaerobolus stellatus SS14]